MRRRIWILVLSAGAILGLGSAAHQGFTDHRSDFEKHVADLCVNAALRNASPAPKN